MTNEAVYLSELTCADNWPARWMTLGEIAAELDRRGAWDKLRFRGRGHKARLDFLASILRDQGAGGDETWVRMGSCYKHAALLTDDDRVLVAEWLEKRRAAFDEDLCRILLGETPNWRRRSEVPAAGFGERLRRARPLVEELSSYLTSDYAEGEAHDARAESPVAKRVEEIAAALTNIFDGSSRRQSVR